MLKFVDNDRKVKIEFIETGFDSLLVFFTRLFGAIQKNWQGVPNIYDYSGELRYKRF
ncbi:hypothetical protein GF389_03365 [Candidatus Dojkabacteria bacterium]|nr:hypothetical protein [Candidatus Dojkabacteria bacterium]